MAWVERIVPSDQDEQFESWRKEFQQERLLRIVREREIMKETAKRCKSYQIREQEANDAVERKRQAILAQRKAATVQATMRFQRNLPGFTVMDPDKFDRAIETITGRQLTNRSTPRRTTTTTQQQQQQRFQTNNTFRRSISMEDLGSRQPIYNPHRNQTIIARTNSVTQVPQYTNQIQYTSPLQEVQRRVLNDFAAQIQTTLHQPQHHEQYDEVNTWERESIDSLEASNHFHPQQIITPQRVTGPIVPSNRIVNTPNKKSNTTAFESTRPTNQQDLLSQSYHESFFVKNTPVTGEEQVTAWLGATKTPSDKHVGIIEKPPSYDGNDSEINAKRKSILKRSPSADSATNNSAMYKKPVVVARKSTGPQARAAGDRARVKDSLEVINAKLLKELDMQKKTVRFAQDSNNERCASDTQLIKQTDMDNEQTSLRRVQSAAMLTPSNRQPIKQTSTNDDRASECSSTTSSKPPIYPLTPTGQARNAYTAIGLKQRELRAKLHKTRYAHSLRQTNTSPTMFDSASARRTPVLTPQVPMPNTPLKQNELNNERRTNDDDENDSLFSELRMSSAPSSHFSQNDARLPPPVPSNTTSKMVEPKLNGTKNSALETHTNLSIEERRVQESIDRLDQQLKDLQTRTRSTSGTRTKKNQKR